MKFKGNFLFFLFLEILFLIFTFYLFFKDVNVLNNVLKYIGGYGSIGVLPYAAMIILIVLFIFEISQTFVILFKKMKFAIGTKSSIVITIFFIVATYLVWGYGNSFPEKIESQVLNLKEVANEYFKKFELYYGGIRKEAAQYVGGYKKYIEKLALIECSPQAGGEGYYCKKYKSIIESKTIDDEWELIDKKISSIYEDVKEKKNKLDYFNVTIELDKLTEIINEAVILSKNLVDKVDSSVVQLDGIVREVEEKFSVEKIVVRDEIAKKVYLSVPNKPKWQLFEPMSEEDKSKLVIKKQNPINFYDVLTLVNKNPLSIVILLLYLFIGLVYKSLLKSNYFDSLIPEKRKEVLNSLMSNLVSYYEDFNFIDWKNYLLSKSPKFNNFIEYESQEKYKNYFDILYYICDQLKLYSYENDIRDILDFSINQNKESIEILPGLRSILISQEAQERFNPSIKRYDLEELRKIISNKLKKSGFAKIELSLSDEAFKKKFRNASEDDDEFLSIDIESRLRDRILQGLNFVIDILGGEIKEIKYIKLFYKTDNGISINNRFLRLIIYYGIYKKIFEFEKSELIKGENLLLEIENEMDNMQINGFSLERLLELETKIDSIDSNINMNPELRIRIYKEIARQFTHRANSQGALTYINKIEQYTKDISNKYINRYVEENIIESRIVLAHNYADNLEYKKALDELENIINMYQDRGDYVIYKAYSAKGHILSISGAPEEGVKWLKKAYAYLPLSMKMQSGITLIRALINIKTKSSFKDAESFINNIENEINRATSEIFELPNNRRFLAFERCRFFYTKTFKDKRFLSSSLNQVNQIVMDWNGENNLKPINILNQKSISENYPEVIALHIKVVLDLLSNRYVDNYASFYSNIIKYLTDNIKRPNIIFILYLILIAEWICFLKVKKFQIDKKQILELKSRIEMIDKTGPLNLFILDIASLINDLLINDFSEELGNRLVEIKSKAEYIPALLPKF